MSFCKTMEIAMHLTDDEPHLGVCMLCDERKILFPFNGAFFCDECLKRDDEPPSAQDPIVPDFGVLLGLLTPRQEQIIRMRLQRMTYDQIGHQFAITRERARQIYIKAMRILNEKVRGVSA